MGHLHRVRDVVDHPADRRRVVVHGRLVDTAQPQRLHRRLLLGAHADDALRQRDLKLLAWQRPPPTCPRPSPTTTSAVNEKRRPPFTTFATRLMDTTRSFNSRALGSIFASATQSLL